MKCTKCGLPKRITDFSFKNKVKRTRHRRCKDCMRPINRAHYRSNPQPYKDRAKENKVSTRKWFLQYLSTKQCVDCGEDDPIVLDFDHTSGKKLGVISHMLHERSKEALLKELDKCEIRCANCHRRKTAREQKWYKAMFEVKSGPAS